MESCIRGVTEHLLISSSGSLNNDGVDAQELCRVQSPVVLLGYLRFEHADGWPTNSLHRSAQVKREFSGKCFSHDLMFCLSAKGK